MSYLMFDSSSMRFFEAIRQRGNGGDGEVNLIDINRFCIVEAVAVEAAVNVQRGMNAGS